MKKISNKKQKGTFKRILAAIMVCTMILSSQAFGVFAAQSQEDANSSLPTVKRYDASEGTFSVTRNSRIFYVSNEKPQGDIAEVLKLTASELAAKDIGNSRVLQIVYGTEDQVKAGDIVIVLGNVENGGADASQAYEMEITEENIFITAQGYVGIKYAMNTLMQNGGEMTCGTVTDYPDVKERSLFWDIGRKFFEVDTIKAMIKDMSWNKMNVLYLDFSNNKGFRFALDDMNLTWADGEQNDDLSKIVSTLTLDQADMDEILAVAKQYGVTVIPTLNSPGHMDWILKYYNSYKKSASTINLENAEAASFVKELIYKYAEYFKSRGCAYFNISADEATGYDTNSEVYVDYVNEIAAELKAMDYTVRMFNDGIKVGGGTKVDSDIQVLYWDPGSANENVLELLRSGHDLVAFTSDYMYYAYGNQWFKCSANNIFDGTWVNETHNRNDEIAQNNKGWNPGKFSKMGVKQQMSFMDGKFCYPTQGELAGNLLGASYAIWCDNANDSVGDTGIIRDTYYQIRTTAERSWRVNTDSIKDPLHDDGRGYDVEQGVNGTYADFMANQLSVSKAPGGHNSDGTIDTANVTLPAAGDIVWADESTTDPGDEDVSDLSDAKLAALANPVVQKYTSDPSAKIWRISEGVRFIIPATQENLDNERLAEVVKLMAAEYAQKEIPSENPITMAYALEENITPTDIVIDIEKDEKVVADSDSEEAYRIEIGKDGVRLVAASENAVIYGLRTIQNMMVSYEGLVYGVIEDYPDVDERRLHVDIARKYITKDWIIQHIRELSFLKLNTIQLHFSENLGFRIECETDPEIVAEEHLTKAEIREIIEEARLYGIKVIPSLDSPGHVDQILDVHPDWGQRDNSGRISESALDISNPEAVAYMKSLYKEYMELFNTSDTFHIGADEYINFQTANYTYNQVLGSYAQEQGIGSTWLDAFAYYVNDIAEFVHDNGFTPRIWNDGIFYKSTTQNVVMHDYIEIDYWTRWDYNMTELQTFIDKGFKKIYNINANYFYYVLRNDQNEASFDYPNQEERIFNQWHPGVYCGRGGVDQIVDYREDFVAGSSLAIWCDNANVATEDEISLGIRKELRGMATKSWNADSNTNLTLDEFRELYGKLGDVAGFEKGSTLPEVGEIQSSDSMGSVTLRYVTDTGKVLKKDVVKYGMLDADYEFAAEEFYGYKVISESAVSGTYKKEGETITFLYQLDTDKSALEGALYPALDEVYYIAETFAEYKEACAAAEAVFENEMAEQIEIDAAYEALAGAKAKVVRLERFALYIETTYPIASDGYVEGYDAYQAAIEAGKEVLKDADTTAAQWLAALEAIRTAKSGLIKAEEVEIEVEATVGYYQNYSYAKMLDGDFNTKCWFETDQTAGDEVVFKFSEPVDMSSIRIVHPDDVAGKDVIHGADIETALNEGEWTKRGELTGEIDTTIEFDKTRVQYVRILLTKTVKYWYQVSEVVFEYELVPADTSLAEMIASAEDIDITGKTPESVADMVDALIAAQKAYVSGKEDTSAEKEALQEAIAGLTGGGEPTVTDKADLIALIEYAETQKENEAYTHVVLAVRQAFEAALTKAIEVNEKATATQDEVDEAYDKLLAKVHLLSFIGGDTTELQTLYDTLKGLDTRVYTEESVKVFEKALQDAKEVLERGENALKGDIEDAFTALDAAWKGLERLPFDKTKLAALIQEANGYVANKDKYLSVTDLESALAGAQDVYARDDVTQDDINTAYSVLLQAIFGLREIPNKNVLEGLIASVQAMDLSDYTADTVRAVKAALAYANEVLEDEGADQKKVDKAVTALEDAVEALKKDTQEDHVVDTKGDGKEDTSSESGTKKRASTDKNMKKTASTGSTAKAAKTGDEMPFVLWGMMLAAACAGVIASVKKKY